MKSKKRLVPFILALAMMMANIIPVSAAPSVAVILNGQYLNYTDVAPQIINSRTMVPLSETATYLGMAHTWNDATRTMYFTKGTRSMVHVLGTSVITVINNGAQDVKTYDTPSQSINGRTVMPVLMLADAIGAKVDWNPTTYTVTIITVTDPEILSATPSTTSLSKDQSVTVTVTANSSTSSVRLMDSSYSILATGSNYVDSGSNRVFTITYTPTASGSQAVSVLGSSDGIVFNNQNTKGFTLTVADNLAISSIEASKTSIGTNKDVTITVYTNESVSRVKLLDGYSGDETTETNYSTSGSQRIFKFTVKSSSARTVKYTATAGTSSSFDSNVSKSVSVTYGSSSTKTTASNMTISQKKSSKNTVITVITYDDIDYVELRNSTGSRVEDALELADAEYYSSTKLQWEFEVKTTDLASKYYIYAYTNYDDDNDDYVSKTYSVGGNSDDDLIYDFEVEPTTRLSVNEKITIIFYSNVDLGDVYVTDPDGNMVTYSTRPTLADSDAGKWRIVFRVEKEGKHILNVESDDGDTATESFTLYLE